MDYQTLVQQLNSTDAASRSRAATDMADLGDLRALQDLAAVLAKETELPVIEACIESIRYLSTSFLRPITPLLQSPNPKIRNGVVEILHDSSESGLALLGELAETGDKDVRKFALDALRGQVSMTAIVIIRRRLRDQDDTVRMTAIEYLGELGDNHSVQEIVKILRSHPHPMVAFNCLNTLAQLDCRDVADELLELYPRLEHVPLLMKAGYLKLLSQIGQPEHLQDLHGILLADSPEGLPEALEALEGICRRHPQLVLPEDLLSRLKHFLQHSPTFARSKILRLLPEEERRALLLEMRRQLRQTNDPSIWLVALETLQELGNLEDLSLFEELAETQEDEDLIDALSETSRLIRLRLEEEEEA